MRKIFFALILLFNAPVFSQDILDTLAKETCTCLETKKSDFSNLSDQDLKTEIGLCMIQSYTTHSAEFKENEKINFSDKEGMTKLGENVAMKMMSFCPSMILEIGKSSQSQSNEEEVEEDIFVSGEVTDIKVDQFISLQLKDKNGRNYTLFLLDYFDTASLITNDELKKKDKLKASYTEIELFDSKAKEFRNFKVLRSLEKE
ncbi:hypothetical protein GON26_02600 [Flavobacterium sp. GA093]|uniref:Uncharacterized protein n=1 Tax=Flavobacterium hydrocarbonoxydans TaxID=2683249 RepID=A0A6I4NF76_9FLAO|nr:hypothetical protein [Flavobacterium hydrocarbonoxydans]MWB93236.1 hypothetical protein [Flavobacterium hydrocarbonoxydans]